MIKKNDTLRMCKNNSRESAILGVFSPLQNYCGLISNSPQTTTILTLNVSIKSEVEKESYEY